MSELSRPVPLQHERSALWSKLLPELSMLLGVLFVLCLRADIGLDYAWVVGPDALAFAAMADAAMLMASGTLIDIASRLQKAPPWWVAPLLPVGLFFAYPESWQMLQMAWQQGYAVLLPFAWSIVERIGEIWTLPKACDLEKIRRRTLVFDRLYVALLLAALWIAAAAIAFFAFGVEFFEMFGFNGLPWAMAAFYAVNVANVIRVHRPAFARRPRSLVPWIDNDQAGSLDPL